MGATGDAAFDVSLPADDEATGVTLSTLSGIVLRRTMNENGANNVINKRASERNLTGRKTTHED